MSDKQVIIHMRRDPAGGDFLFEHRNEQDAAIKTDGTIGIGGGGKAFTPMELLLAGIAGCSAIDVVLIFNKKKRPIDDIQARVTAKSVQKDNSYSVYESIHIDYYVASQTLTEEEVKYVIEMSLDKYCSVARVLEHDSQIDYTCHMNITP